jgi:hypothetical protein
MSVFEDRILLLSLSGKTLGCFILLPPQYCCAMLENVPLEIDESHEFALSCHKVNDSMQGHGFQVHHNHRFGNGKLQHGGILMWRAWVSLVCSH